MSSSHPRHCLVIVSFPFSFPPSRYHSFISLIVSYHILFSSIALSLLHSCRRYRHRRYPYHEPATVNTNKNELNKTAHTMPSPSHDPPSQSEIREQNPDRPDRMMTRTSPPRHTRTASPPRMATRAKRDGMRTRRWAKGRHKTPTTRYTIAITKRDKMLRHETTNGRHRPPASATSKTQGRNETRRKDEKARCYDETRKREARTRRNKREAATGRQHETQKRDAKRDEKTRRHGYILKTDHWPSKRLSTFSTMREYNTDTRRRTIPSDEIHNMNTMDIRCRISN